jgi:hypothetical protein
LTPGFGVPLREAAGISIAILLVIAIGVGTAVADTV